jgi:hypothetical protein
MRYIRGNSERLTTKLHTNIGGIESDLTYNTDALHISSDLDDKTRQFSDEVVNKLPTKPTANY